jgi:hypothetical protein
VPIEDEEEEEDDDVLYGVITYCRPKKAPLLN